MFSKIRKKGIEKKRLLRICKVNKVSLDFQVNKNEIDLLSEIFENREYADYFPFYSKVTIVDIGAHYGYFSLFSALNTDQKSIIIAIEPEDSNFKQLEKNISGNPSLKNIIPLNCAIGASNKSAKLFKGNTINNSIINDFPLLNKEMPTQDIEIKTIEQLMKETNIEKIDFLKMDCEGAEYGVFENTPKTVLDKITTISMEFHDLKNPKYTGQFIIGILLSAGFEIVKYKYERTTMGLNYGKLIGTKIYNR